MSQPPPTALAPASLAFLEAAYAWELDDETWMRRLVTAYVGFWGRPRWACGFEYDVSSDERFHMGAPVFWNPSSLPAKMLIDRIAARGTALAHLYRTVNLGFSVAVGGIDEGDAEILRAVGTADLFCLNGLDGSGCGTFLTIGTERRTLSPEEATVLPRLAAHLASAYRCRQRLKQTPSNPLDGSEAVITPDGEILEARGLAQSASARRALGSAAQSIERLRRRGGPQEPTASWRPRVVGRWTLVDSYTSGGDRYILARENQTHIADLRSLTDREQQVVISAAIGRTIKETAYELGISDSTARVLLSRAYARLGVKSHSELLALPIIRGLRGEAADD